MSAPQKRSIRRTNEIDQQLRQAGLRPGMSLFAGVNVTKQLGLANNVACKWKRNYRKKSATEGWFY